MILELQDVKDLALLIAQGKAPENTPLLMAQEHIESGGTVTVNDNGFTVGTATTLDNR